MRNQVVAFVLVFGIFGCASHSKVSVQDVPSVSTAFEYQKINNVNDPAEIKSALSRVNFLVNSQIEYTDDRSIYGVEDYWASPQEVITNGKGDCEDYAFLKRDLLIKMGVPSDRLKLIHADVKESGPLAGNSVEQHIVLAYYRHDSVNNPMILDNMTPKVMFLRSRKDFQLNYVFDESTVWQAKGYSREKVIYNTDILPKFNKAITGVAD